MREMRPSVSLYCQLANDRATVHACFEPVSSRSHSFKARSIAKGVTFGTFSCEQLETPIDWTQRQLQALRKIASRASLTLMHVVNASVDTTPGALWETSTPNRLATMPMPLDPPPLPPIE